MALAIAMQILHKKRLCEQQRPSPPHTDTESSTSQITQQAASHISSSSSSINFLNPTMSSFWAWAYTHTHTPLPTHAHPCTYTHARTRARTRQTNRKTDLRGPAAIQFVSRDTCSNSIAKPFRACFYGVSHDYRAICCKMGYYTDVPV